MLDRLTPEMVLHVRTLIEQEIVTHFRPHGREYPGGQRAIAAKFHLAQPTLNRFLKKGEGLGLDMLIGIRAYFEEAGRPKTLDQILGLEASPAPVLLDQTELLERMARLEAEMRGLARLRPGKSAKAAKILEQAERARLRAVGQSDLDQKRVPSPRRRKEAG